MGAGASLSHLPETMTKSECMVLVGSSFSDDMWTAHSHKGVITRESLLQIYTSRTDRLTQGLDMVTLKVGSANTKNMSNLTKNKSKEDPPPPPIIRPTRSKPSTYSPETDTDSDRDLNTSEKVVSMVQLTAPDGSSTYEGSCCEGVPHGVGKFSFKSGAFYEGGYRMGSKHGRGICKYTSGAIYCGEWVADKRDGQGVLRLPSGDEYRGEWEANVKSGQGRYSYGSVDGGVYTGEWKHDQKHGTGTYVYTNGDTYSGYWVMGKKSGAGKYTYASGEVYDGDWNANVMHGHGKFCDATGKVAYEGAYKFGSIFNFGAPSTSPGDNTIDTDLARPDEGTTDDGAHNEGEDI